MKRMAIGVVLLAMAAVMAVVSAALAVVIGVGSVDQLGGSNDVAVNCPANPCQITSVKWVVTSGLVDKVQVTWQTAATSGSYTVHVALIDNTNTVIASASATQSASASAVTTTVDFSPDVNPAQVYKVRIVIVQN
jgi:hypothetical protein